MSDSVENVITVENFEDIVSSDVTVNSDHDKSNIEVSNEQTVLETACVNEKSTSNNLLCYNSELLHHNTRKMIIGQPGNLVSEITGFNKGSLQSCHVDVLCSQTGDELVKEEMDTNNSCSGVDHETRRTFLQDSIETDQTEENLQRNNNDYNEACDNVVNMSFIEGNASCETLVSCNEQRLKPEYVLLGLSGEACQQCPICELTNLNSREDLLLHLLTTDCGRKYRYTRPNTDKHLSIQVQCLF